MSNKTQFVQATTDNVGLGSTVRNDDGIVGKVTKLPKRGPVTVTPAEGNPYKAEIKSLEVDLKAPVTLAEASGGEAPAKATPVRQRAETITRVVDGREYTYKNLGGGRIDNGDDVAQALRGKDLAEVYEITAKTLGVTVEELQTAYSGNNAGRQRMTLGNLMRSHAKQIAAGLAYVPPFRAEAEKAKRKEEREAARAKAKEEKAAKQAEKKAAAEAAKKVKEEKAAARKQEAADKAAAAKAAKAAAAEAKKAAAQA